MTVLGKPAASLNRKWLVYLERLQEVFVHETKQLGKGPSVQKKNNKNIFCCPATFHCISVF